MTTPLQNAIIAGSTIGSLLANYIPNETNKNIKQIRADIKKMMYRRSRSNKKEFLEAIKIADTAWRNTINHFVEVNDKMPIEALFSSMRIHDLYAEPLKRFANISEKKMEKAMFLVDEKVSLEHETNSYEAIDYFLNLVGEHTGIKRENKLSRLAYTIKQNIIIEQG